MRAICAPELDKSGEKSYRFIRFIISLVQVTAQLTCEQHRQQKTWQSETETRWDMHATRLRRTWTLSGDKTRIFGLQH